MTTNTPSDAEKSKSTESRNEKFCRIAEYRTNRIIDMIRLLGNCSNKSTYDYTPEQVEQIFRAISEATAEAKSRFTVKKEDKTFKLKRP